MSVASGISVHPEVMEAYSKLRFGRGEIKFIIFKIADNRQEIVVEEMSGDDDYEVFRSKITAAKDAKGCPSPRFAVYDVEYDLGGGEGKRNKIVFISWVPENTPMLWSMVYATSRQTLKNALNPSTSIHADENSELEWKNVVMEASRGKAQ